MMPVPASSFLRADTTRSQGNQHPVYQHIEHDHKEKLLEERIRVSSIDHTLLVRSSSIHRAISRRSASQREAVNPT